MRATPSTCRRRSLNSGFDPATFKPALKLSIVDGQVRVNFTKGECDRVAVYCRERGTLGRTKLGIDTNSPYFDTKPLANPTVPEVREYISPWRHRRCRDRDRERNRLHRPRRLSRMMNEETGKARSPLFYRNRRATELKSARLWDGENLTASAQP